MKSMKLKIVYLKFEVCGCFSNNLHRCYLTPKTTEMLKLCNKFRTSFANNDYPPIVHCVRIMEMPPNGIHLSKIYHWTEEKITNCEINCLEFNAQNNKQWNWRFFWLLFVIEHWLNIDRKFMEQFLLRFYPFVWNIQIPAKMTKATRD